MFLVAVSLFGMLLVDATDGLQAQAAEQRAAQDQVTATSSPKEPKKVDPKVALWVTASEALKQAEQSKSEVLIPELTTQFSQTHAQADGVTLRSHMSPGPVRVKVGDAWTDLNTNLLQNGDVLVPTVAGDSVAISNGGGLLASVGTAKNQLGLAAKSLLKSDKSDFSTVAEATDAEDPSVGLGFPTIKLTPEQPKQQSAPSPSSSSTPSDNPPASSSPAPTQTAPQQAVEPTVVNVQGSVPQVLGSSASFANFGPGMSGVVTAGVRGFGLDVMLAGAPTDNADLDVSFPVALSGGLVLAKEKPSAGHDLLINDASEHAVGTVGAVRIVDSNAEQPKVLWGQLSTDASGKVMSLHVPRSTWTHKDLQFPVRVSTHVTIGADAFGIGYDPENPPDRFDMRVGVLNSSHKARAYMRFPLKASLPKDVTITSASFGVVQSWTGNCSSNNELKFAVLKEPFKATSSSSSAPNNGWPGPSFDPVGGRVEKANRTKPASSGCEEAASGKYWDASFNPALVQDWYDGKTTDHGVALAGHDDGSSDETWKRFCSTIECSQGLEVKGSHPDLAVDYELPKPNTPSGLSVTPASGGFVTSHTPTLRASFGSKLYPVTGVFHVVDQAGGTVAYSGEVTVHNSGQATATDLHGQLVDNHTYVMEVWGENAGGSGPTAKSAPFQVDTTPPGVVHVDSATAQTATGPQKFESGQWVSKADGTKPVAFAFTGAVDVTAIRITQDGRTLPDIAAPKHQATSSWTTGDGWHVLSVVGVDRAGQVGQPTVFSFGIGNAGMVAPGVEDRSAKYFPVAATGPKIAGAKARLAWKGPQSTSFQTITKGVYLSNGSVWDGTVVDGAQGVMSLPDGLTWNVAEADQPTPAIQAPSVIQLKVQFMAADGTTVLSETQPRTLEWVTHAFGGNFATDDVGPGTVALSTGEFQLEATDATLPGPGEFTVGRTYLSLEANPGPGYFGPGWSTEVPTPGAGSGTSVPAISPGGQTVTLTNPNGSTDVYGNPTAVSGGKKYTGIGVTSQEGGYATVDNTGTQFTFTDTDGSVTLWKNVSNTWILDSIKAPTTSSNSRTFMQAATQDADGYVATVTGRYTSGTAAADCSALPDLPTAKTTVGCRILTLTVSKLSANKPMLTDGNYPGRANGVWTHVWDGNGHAVDQQVSSYAYTPEGMLSQQWDPRLPTPLVSSYSYQQGSDNAFRLATVTPASTNNALQPYNLSYDTAFRLVKSSRTQPAGGTANTFVVYGVPVAGDGTHLPKLDPQTTQTWDQPFVAAPASAVAVFDPDPLAGESFEPPPADQPTDSRWVFADIEYMNGQGAMVNEAVVGAGQWLVDTTEYDNAGSTGGQVVQNLTAANRAIALMSDQAQCQAQQVATSICELPSAQRAQALTTYTTYSAPGVVSDVYGPVVAQATPASKKLKTAATIGLARTHTHSVYNEGAPQDVTDSGASLVTTTTTGQYPYSLGLVPPSGVGPVPTVDARTIKQGYELISGPAGSVTGWSQRTATTSTIKGVDGGDITTTTAINADGNTIQQRQPNDPSGTSAGTTVSYYYSAGQGTLAECGNHPGWDGLLCRSGPAAQPSTGLPVTTVTDYTTLLQPRLTQEVPQPGTSSESTVQTYDQIGRVIATQIDPAGPDAGQPVGATGVMYSTDTGLQLSTFRDDKTVSTSYDSWGRVVTSTDSTGNTSHTTYDLAGQVASFDDGSGNPASTYTYDSPATNDSLGEHRGLVTAQHDSLGGSAPGDWTIGWLLNGEDPAAVVAPNGVLAKQTDDPAGNQVVMSYETSDGSVLGSWVQSYNTHSQVVAESGPASAGQSPQGTYTASYSYDAAARLRNETFTGDGTGGVTSSRSYSLDADSNRIGQTVTGSGAQTRRGAFNAADQLITSTSGSTAGSYKYDSFGRTTALPGVDSASGDTTLTWKANDRVATQTSAGHTMTYTDDPTDRRVGVADTTDSQIQYMYADDSDEPAMLRTTAAGATKTQRFTDTPIGGLGVTTTSLASTGVRKLWSDQQSVTSELNLSNPHGDVIATIPNTPNVTKDQMTPVSTYTAFGLDQPNSTGKNPYGWEGSNQRDTINTAGLITMGARIYNPTTGRFLTLDPVEGGNDNNYTYPVDPVNMGDLDGELAWFVPIGMGIAVVARVAIRTVPRWAPRVRRYVNRGWTAYKNRKKSPAKNSGRKGHRKSRSKNKYNKHSKAQGHGGSKRWNPRKPPRGYQGKWRPTRFAYYFPH